MTTVKRVAEPPDGKTPVQRIEIDFSLPTYITREQDRALHQLLDEIVNSPCNQPQDGVHWVSGCGAKPRWSQADAHFLGKQADEGAPKSGEPTFDDRVYAIETTARGFVSERERERVAKERARKQ